MGTQGRRLDRLAARGYGFAYDAVVDGFPPYERLVEEIAGLLSRGGGAAGPRATRVLDVACGTGSVASRLAGHGFPVVAVDPVEHLVEVARRLHRGSALDLTFHHADVAREPVPGAPYDALVSMHTLYWHAEPEAFLAGCRRALRPGGHAAFLTYARPAHVIPTFRELYRAQGLNKAVRGLRWLVPTAAFERLRRIERRYYDREAFHAVLRAAGFEVLEARRTFLAGISHLAWTRVAR
ncbi:MAG TPA: class I SAM-dependent methyltransferase [Candidatus Tectomicrobia bacterium]|nr:class I SAM-dependent methyltransferase [Candidatus Tectomicrobia bacterium]